MMIETAEEFVRLRRSQRPEEYRRASAEAAPLDVWLEVVATYPDMRFWVAQNKTVPQAVLEMLSDDDDIRTREMVARKRSAGPALLARLATDPAASVRLAVARNPKTPVEILSRLRDDEVREVAAAAERP